MSRLVETGGGPQGAAVKVHKAPLLPSKVVHHYDYALG
jgi:hypothetical protein